MSPCDSQPTRRHTARSLYRHCCSWSSMNPNTAKIVIVGAGIAGLAAASKLHEAGFTNTVILEAQDRVGGRIFTSQFGGSHIEIGAQWIHGQVGNPLYDMAKTLQLLDEDADEKTCEKEEYFYMASGEVVDEKMVEEVRTVMDSLFLAGNQFHRNGVPLAHDTQSVGEFFDEGFKKYIAENGLKDSKEVRIKEGLYSWRKLYEHADNACYSLYDLSLKAWGEYFEYDGLENTNLKHGFKPLLDSIYHSLPKNVIRLKTPVKNIKWTETSGERTSNKILVSCENGETDEADFVIVTSSVGYLQENANTVFTPSLPQSKLQALNSCGYGVVDKLFLQFEEPFWEKDCGAIYFTWLKDQKVNLESLKDVQCEDPWWYREILGFDVVANHDNVLLGWITGHAARQMEQISDKRVANVCLELLKTFTGLKELPTLTNFTRSCWYSDKYVRGSYSYRTTKTKEVDCDILVEPLPSTQNPQLLFAGEATDKNYFSTTHGAYMSGLREADRIIDHVTRQVTPSVV